MNIADKSYWSHESISNIEDPLFEIKNDYPIAMYRCNKQWRNSINQTVKNLQLVNITAPECSKEGINMV